MPEVEANRRRYEDSIMRLVALAREEPEFADAANVAADRLTVAFNERVVARNKETILLDRLVAGLRSGDDAATLTLEIEEERRRDAAAVLTAKNELGKAVHDLVAAVLDHGDDQLFAAALVTGQAKVAFDDAHAKREHTPVSQLDLSLQPPDITDLGAAPLA